MHIVVVVERLEELADFLPLLSVRCGTLLGHVAEFACHHRPAVLRQPLRDGVEVACAP